MNYWTNLPLQYSTTLTVTLLQASAIIPHRGCMDILGEFKGPMESVN